MTNCKDGDEKCEISYGFLIAIVLYKLHNNCQIKIMNENLPMMMQFFVSVIDDKNNPFILWSNFIEKCAALDIIDMIMLKYGNA